MLSRYFRRCFLEELEKAHRKGDLRFHGALAVLEDLEQWRRWLEPIRRTEWVVYAKPPFGGAKKVFDYLGRYTHRVAISNHRILDVADGKVTFQWRDYRRDQRQRTMTLAAEEFIRRFLLHVLPTGFVRIRYFGFLSHRYREKRLEQARHLLGDLKIEPPEASEDQVTREALRWQRDEEPALCPKCRRGRLVRVKILEPDPQPPDEVDGIDSS